jgi:hypothetical protein
LFGVGCSVDNASSNNEFFKFGLSDIVNIPWDLSLKEIQHIYPGGIYYEGDSERKVVSSYLITIFLKDLSLQSRLSFHITSTSNFIKNSGSKLIKNLILEYDDSEKLFEAINTIIEELSVNFPQGGSIYNDDLQIGYFIPTNDIIEGVSINWSVDEKRNTLNVVLQKR